jgi:hypothetical protein
MSENVSAPEAKSACPRCGASAEKGWLRGGEGPLSWHPGPYSTLKNAFAFGERVGIGGFLTCAHVDANRCPKCRVIWLQY